MVAFRRVETRRYGMARKTQRAITYTIFGKGESGGIGGVTSGVPGSGLISGFGSGFPLPFPPS